MKPGTLLLLASLLSLPSGARAASAPRRPRSDADTKEARIIPIDDKRATKIYRIRTAPSYATTIEFPEDFAAPPVCGDCSSGAAPSRGEVGALFRIDVFREQRYLTVKPLVTEADMPADEIITTLTVPLKHFTLTLQVEYADRRKADARVVFTVPERAAEKGFLALELALEKKRLEEEYNDKVEKGLELAFMRAFAGPHRCSSVSRRTRHDDIVVEVRELCAFESKMIVAFTVENRAREPADLAEVILRAGAIKGGGEGQQYFSSKRAAFQDMVSGVALIPWAEKGTPRIDLTLYEAGGKGREVTVENIGF